ncbi:MBL fold metallo-hydrolase [Streptomyces sp. NPDC055140]
MTLPENLIPLGGGAFLWDTRAKPGTWGNANCVLIVSGDEAVLVDTPYDNPTTKGLLSACRRVLPEGAEIQTIVNTHANGDHTFGNQHFRQHFPQVEIISSKVNSSHVSRELSPKAMHMLVSQGDGDDPLGWYMRQKFSEYDFAGIKVVGPTRTFEAHHTVRVGDLDVQLIEVGPAHTEGDVIAYVAALGLVVAGDVIFNGDHPVHWAGPLANVIEANRAILTLAPDVIIPGHGRKMTVKDLEAHIRYLEDLRGLIAEHHSAGDSPLDATTAIVRRGFHPHLGGPERLVALASVEYAHIDRAESPSQLKVAEAVAHWAFQRHKGRWPGAREERAEA